MSSDEPKSNSQFSLPGVYIKTFGCQMNEYDTEKMLSGLSDKYQPVSEPDQADVIIVNTCSVREKAEKKLFDVLGRYRELKQKNPKLVIGVGGCVAQQEGKAIIKRNKAVDFVVGTHNISLVPSLVKRAQEGMTDLVAVDYREEWEDLPAQFSELGQDVQGKSELINKTFGVYSSPVRAMVAIQRGCNKHCAFCVVPTTRGPEVSRSAQEIIREIKLKVRMGAKEVMLLGQTVNSYGRDLNPKFLFSSLIREIAEIDGLERIRFTSPHPQDVRDDFIQLYHEVPSLCPYIHLPMQSGSDRMLKLMNRNYRKARYFEIIDNLKEARPDIAITSDFIVGFPTESEEDFEETLEAISKVEFGMTYSFVYSKRPNTTALTDFRSDQEVPVVVAKERLFRLQALQKTLSLKFNEKSVGQVEEVLIEAKDERGIFKGRSRYNTLVEIVNLTENNRDLELSLGKLVNVKIEKASPHALRGTMLTTN